MYTLSGAPSLESDIGNLKLSISTKRTEFESRRDHILVALPTVLAIILASMCVLVEVIGN